jgi:hypothetical protein
VLPSILHIVGSILLRASLSSTSISETRRILECVIQSTRKESLQIEIEERTVFAQYISTYIVSRVSNTVSELRGKSLFNDDFCESEGENENLASSLIMGPEAEIIKLFNKHDECTIAAKKSWNAVNVTICLSYRGTQSISPCVESESILFNKEELLKIILGEVGVARMRRDEPSRDKPYRKIVVKKEKTDTDDQFEIVKLESSFETYNQEREMVAARMQELRREMRQLEEDDKELCEIIAATTIRLSSLENDRFHERMHSTEQLNENERLISHKAILNLLADELKDYAETLHQAITVSTLINVHDNMSEVAQSKLGFYLARIRDYFSSKAKCIAFLHARAENLDREADDVVCYSSVVKAVVNTVMAHIPSLILTRSEKSLNVKHCV